MTHNEYLKLNGVRMWKTWGAPYFRSRTLKNRKALLISKESASGSLLFSFHYFFGSGNNISYVKTIFF